MQRGNQRYEKMIGRQAEKEDHEPALRKTGNVEEADKHHTRNHRNEKYRQQPVEIDGCETDEPQITTPKRSVRLTSFLRGPQPLASRLFGPVCNAELMKSCSRSHASERAAAFPSATLRSSDVWMVLPGKFRSNQPLPPLDFAIRRNGYVRRRVPDCP